MKRTITIAALLLLSVATMLPAHGQRRQKPPPPVQEKPFAERWLAECGAGSRPRPEYCYGYAEGFAHALHVWQELAPQTLRLCPPERWDYDPLLDAAAALLRQHETLSVAAAMHIAYASAWECPKGHDR